MEIIINGLNFTDLLSKFENIDVTHMNIINQLNKVSAGTFREDEIVRHTNSEKDLGSL